MKRFFVYLLVFSLISTASAQSLFQGQVYDISVKTAIPYATVVVKGSKIGVLADELGNFRLELDAEIKPTDTIIISSVSHLPKKISVKEAASIKEIYLDRKIPQLKTAYVKPFLHSANLGIMTGSKNVHTAVREGTAVGWSQHLIGGEAGKMFTFGQIPYKLVKLRFKFFSGFDSAWFRLHIRKFNDSIPGEELLNEDIIIGVAKREGILEYELSSHALVIDEQVVCVSLELLRLADRPPGRSRALFLLAGHRPGDLYIKTLLTSTWLKKQDFQLAMQLGIKY